MLSQLKDWMETHPGWEVLSDSEDSGDDSQDDDGELYDYVDYIVRTDNSRGEHRCST